MFGNRKLEVKLVKDNNRPVAHNDDITPHEWAAIAVDLGKKVVVGTCVVIATTIVLTAASQIAVNKLTNPQ